MLREAEDSASSQSVPPTLDVVTGGMEQMHISTTDGDHAQDTESMHSLDLTQVICAMLGGGFFYYKSYLS